MHFHQMDALLERCLREAVTRHYPRDWDENSITHDLMIRLRESAQNFTLYDAGWTVDMQWDIHKLHGQIETLHGDIGVLISHRLPDGSTITGAGFIEAKRRGQRTDKFPYVRKAQTAQLLSASPYTQLLLYDYDSVLIVDELHTSRYDLWDAPISTSQTYETYGPVISLQLANAINRYDRAMYRFCSSFSRQFTRRYFRLHDLDYRPEVIEALRGFGGQYEPPSYVMRIRSAPAEYELPNNVTVNDNVYEYVAPPPTNR